MLHLVNPPDCLGDMKKLLGYQRKFLGLLIFHPDPLDKSVFESYFEKKLGRWSWLRVYWGGKPTKKFGQIVEPLVAYADLHRVDCKEVYKIILHDHLFANKHTCPDFYFKFSTLSQGWRDVLTPFFQAFYEILHDPGYPQVKFDFKKGDLSWHSLMDAQYQVNQNVCPYCDGEQGDKTERIDANDADHWLPKSIYPHLSVHWANLFRSCMVCNERFKGDDNPIKHQGSGELKKTYHPYQKPAFHSVGVDVKRESAHPRHYQLALKDDENPLCANALEQVLTLSERWSGRVNKRLKANKSALIADQVREAKYKKGSIDEGWVKETLSMVAQFRHEDLGSKPNAISEKAVLNYQREHETGSLFYVLSQAHR